MSKIQIDSDALEQINTNEDYYENNLSLISQLKSSPIPENELSRNLFLYQDRRALSRFLFIHELYEKSIHLHGNIFEFGVRYGVNTSLFTSLRGILEPFNHNRKLVAFDTFEGFASVDSEKDGDHVENGSFGVTQDYELYLKKILCMHEKLAPIENIQKFKLVKGDVIEVLPNYLAENPETIISLAYFDFDIYQPTITSLIAIEPYLSDGAIIAFDEINTPEWPGETVALREWIGDRNMPILHSQFRSAAGYVVYRR